MLKRTALFRSYKTTGPSCKNLHFTNYYTIKPQSTPFSMTSQKLKCLYLRIEKSKSDQNLSKGLYCNKEKTFWIIFFLLNFADIIKNY